MRPFGCRALYRPTVARLQTFIARVNDGWVLLHDGAAFAKFYLTQVPFGQSTFSSVKLYSLDCPVFGMDESLTWKAERTLSKPVST